VIDALAPVALGWSLLTGAVEIEAVRRAVFRRAKAPGSAAALRVLLVRPCAGSEPWLSRTLPSLAAARRSFSVTCRFAVAGPGDGALPAAREAATSLSAAGIDASVVLTAARAPNHKAAQLAAVVAA
jgi:hypothetical protein